MRCDVSDKAELCIQQKSDESAFCVQQNDVEKEKKYADEFRSRLLIVILTIVKVIKCTLVKGLEINVLL